MSRQALKVKKDADAQLRDTDFEAQNIGRDLVGKALRKLFSTFRPGQERVSIFCFIVELRCN